MPEKEDSQVRINFIYNIINLFVNVIIGLLYTPYLVNKLGVIAYGVVPLALIINQYIGVVTNSLTSSLTRFYSIALQKNDFNNASNYLNTSLFVIILIIIVSILPLFFIITKIDKVFNIPIDLILDAKKLFAFTILSFYISLISSILNITLYAYNRLDYLNIIKILRTSLKFVFVITLFNLYDKNISNVGLALLFTEIFTLFVSIYFFKKYSAGKIRIKLFNMDKAVLFAILELSLWVMIQQVGDTGIYRIDNIIVNIFWSTKESGTLGALSELGVYIMTISSVIGSLFGPLILIAYSKEDHDKVKSLSLDRSISVGIIVAAMCGVVIGFSKPIIKIWLGPEFVHYNNWLNYKLCLIPFYSAAGVFAFASRAWNKVKFPALMTLLIGVFNIILAFLIGKYLNSYNNAIELILLVGLILGIIQSYFLNGLYFSHIYKGTKKTVISNSGKIFLSLMFTTIISYLVSNFIISLKNYISLIIMMITGIILFTLNIKIFLNKEQYDSMLSLIIKKI